MIAQQINCNIKKIIATPNGRDSIKIHFKLIKKK
jgi:hypothetical protein